MNSQTKLDRLLGDLGAKSSDEIASFLEGQGLVGQQGFSRQCPLAVYLSQTLGLDVSVGMLWITLYRQHKAVSKFLTPESVRIFIDYFDHGIFPNLIRKEKPHA